jgi:hypothetical protein
MGLIRKKMAEEEKNPLFHVRKGMKNKICLETINKIKYNSTEQKKKKQCFCESEHTEVKINRNSNLFPSPTLTSI